jgi:pimeloyl-ACP methyl ester carboxylesterase
MPIFAPPARCDYADARRLRLHYARCGPRGAPAVLLLRQTARSCAEYHAVLPLRGQRWDAIALDTPGFGASPPLPGEASTEGWAAAAAALLEALGIGRANVVGHHTGGVIAIELAAAFPERAARLVLSSTPWIDADERRRRAERAPIDQVSVRADGSHLTQLWQCRAAFYAAGRDDLLHAFVVDALKAADPEEGHRAVTRYPMEDRIGRVTQPTLVIRALGDPFAAPHALTLADRLADARVIDIAAGMVPLPDQLPEAFAAAVDSFIGSHR